VSFWKRKKGEDVLDVDEVFSSKLRIKILKILAEIGELNVSEIARRLGVNYNTAKGHLKVLEGEDILQHKVFGRIRLYRLNERSLKARSIRNLIEVWEQNP
jgi:predicted ArsR family transcriptional regulator